jgi:uncharacterized protein
MNGIYEPQRSNHKVMNRETLGATINLFCSIQDEIEFIWHGGEPLLAGKEFYRSVSELQRAWAQQGKTIANFIQTNCYRVDEEWADLFAKLGFCVGVSFDAPAIVHDRVRNTASGELTSSTILENIKLLQEREIFNGVSCCVGKSNIAFAREILSFFLERNIKSLKFLRIKETAGNPCGETITAGQFSKFMEEIFALWIALDDPELEIRDIRSMTDILLGGGFRECTFMGKCEQFVTIYSDGSIFPCDSIPNHPSLRMGSVFDGYSDLISSMGYRKLMSAQSDARDHCRDCSLTEACRGGCLQDRLNDNVQPPDCTHLGPFKAIHATLVGFGLLKD